MARGQYRWPPRTGELVYLQTRHDDGEVSCGKIIGIDRDPDDSSSNDIHVLFHAPDRNINRGGGGWERAYDGTTCFKIEGNQVWVAHTEKWEQIDTSKWRYIWIGPELNIEGSSELLTFRQGDFEGCYSSNTQRWELD